MKYFTREELNEISKELMENPSRETLYKLNEKYNGSDSSSVQQSKDWVEVNNDSSSVENNINSGLSNGNAIWNSDIGVMPQKDINNVEVNNGVNVLGESNMGIPNLNIQSMDNSNGVPTGNNALNDNAFNNNQRDSFGLPTTENLSSNSGFGEIPFNGNLWGMKENNSLNGMMQTTDNFNTMLDSEQQNNSVPINNMFFSNTSGSSSNPIPIEGQPKMDGPTMFGQFEQNFNGNNAA